MAHARVPRTAAAAALLALAWWLAPVAADAAARLAFEPVGAPVGTHVVARATGLAPSTRFTLVWITGRAAWRVEDGKFLGIRAPEERRPLLTATSDASGALQATFDVPEDFGYLHDVELHPAGAALDGEAATHQGFTVVPHLTISPAWGPPGTPITVTVTGLGYRFYQVVWHLLYDGARTGWLSGVTTHGTARVTIPAAGEVGWHTLQAIEGPTAPFLNGEQGPNFQPLIPIVIGDRFRIVGGPTLPAPAAASQVERRARADRLPAAAAGPALAVDYASGTVGTPLQLRGSGFAPRAMVTIEWETYVGNRLSGRGWEAVRRPFATVTADAAGRFVYATRTPDDLGGPHRFIARVGDGTAEVATAAYAIAPSVFEITPATVRPGDTYTVHMKGVGWTETFNTYTMVVDNAYFGYACGFNSQGDVTIHVRAPGRTGRHYVDLYPTIYRGEIAGPGLPPQGSQVNGSYFLLPMLNAADHPGERLPAFHLAFNVR